MDGHDAMAKNVSAKPQIVDFDDPHYDPFADSTIIYATTVDPFALMAELRKTGAVHEVEYRVALGQPSAATLPDGMRCFLVVAYDEVQQVFLDTETYSNAIFEQTLGLSFGRTITAMDAPEHAQYRRIFQKAFLPNAVAKWSANLVDPVVDSLLAKLMPHGEADLMDDFAQHYPFGVIYKMLNLPAQDTHIFHRLAVGQTNFYIDISHPIEAGQKLGAYFAGILAARRAEPGEDLVSALLQADVDGEFLPDDVIISFLRQLMNAGGETTFRATGTLLGQLLLHPAQYQAIEKDRSLLPKAVDEALRWDNPVIMTYRLAVKDTVLGGVNIPAGSMIQVALGAANRDPAHFPDPDKFDIFRDNKSRTLRFGNGPHVCIGQHLAKLEMTRAVNVLMDRLPNLRLDPDRPPPAMQGSELRSPDHVYVKFD